MNKPPKPAVTHKLVIKVEEKLLFDMLVSADNYVTYWCYLDQSLTAAVKKSARVLVHDPFEQPREQRLHRGKILDGLALIALENPKFLAKFLANDCDGPAADVIVQYALFQKVVFQ